MGVRARVCVCVYVCERALISDRADGCFVVAFHFDPVHHLNHGLDTHVLPDRGNKAHEDSEMCCNIKRLGVNLVTQQPVGLRGR